MSNNIISIRNYDVYDKETHSVIVSVDSLDIKKGDIIFLLGNNGSGKSTLIKSLFSVGDDNQNYYYVGLNDNLKAEGYIGNKFIDLSGRDNISSNDLYKFISYMHQTEVFYFADSIVDSLMRQSIFALKEIKSSISKNEKKEKYKKIEGLAKDYCVRFLKKDFDKTNKYSDEEFYKFLKKKRAVDCSFGQQKLIGLLSTFIKTLCFECQLLVMDEPLNHLDASNKIVIKNLLNEIVDVREKGGNPLTIIMISHCLVFDFIKNSNCYEYKIVDKKITLLNEKIYHRCLENIS